MTLRPEQVARLDVPGARLVTIDTHQDSQGLLWDMIHRSDPFVRESTVSPDRTPMGDIRQVYVVTSPRADVVRGLFKHARHYDWFHVVHGAGLFNLVWQDFREETLQLGELVHDQVVLSARKPQLLAVPPGTWHGWMSLEPDTVLICAASHERDPDDPDGQRANPGRFYEHLGDLWKVEAR